MGSDSRWSHLLTPIGFTALLFGAIDPLEGAFLGFAGSGLVTLGALLNHAERRVVVYRTWVFVLVTAGSAALWGLSMVGGFGGASGRSNWWGVLLLPYLLGWSMGLWGLGSPRWIWWPGIAAGMWYLVLAGAVLWASRTHGASLSSAPFFIGAVGVLTIAGCSNRLHRDRSRHT